MLYRLDVGCFFLVVQRKLARSEYMSDGTLDTTDCSLQSESELADQGKAHKGKVMLLGSNS